ncbi:unnamed protein product [Notodromas monacha]|uniref:Uncharacterized protein n=1 Tax=Notodromas monacha TaxID=399045 RepID=A0A7R9BNR2_9CRUS|nr:unnamed protein product [Notodromas monacha]CAG0918867.1 unnamed protein product [Notodromas monacha]
MDLEGNRWTPKKTPKQGFRFLRSLLARIIPLEATHRSDRIRVRLSYLYVFFAWNALGLLVYANMKRKDELGSNWKKYYTIAPGKDEAEGSANTPPPGVQWANVLELPGNVHYYRMKGSSIAEEFTMSEEERKKLFSESSKDQKSPAGE